MERGDKGRRAKMKSKERENTFCCEKCTSYFAKKMFFYRRKMQVTVDTLHLEENAMALLL